MKAKLSTANPKDWFVYWRDENGRMFKIRLGINRIKSTQQRREFGRQLLAQTNETLKTGKVELYHPAIKLLRNVVESKKLTLRRRSWQSYLYAVNSFEKFLPDKEIKIHEIDRKLARAFIDSLVSSGQKGKSINGVRGFLTAIFNHYGENHDNFINPFKGTKKQQEDIGKNIAFSEDQMEKLWAAMDPNMKLFTRFIYFTYIRPIELLRLRVRDVRMEMRQIIIHGDQSKNKKQQSVVIPDSFLMELQDLDYGKMPGDWYLFGKGLKSGPEPYSRNSVTKYHSKILEKLKFEKSLTLYSWKHTGVVAAYNAGIDLYSIMRQLRHHSLDMTQIYLKSLGLIRNNEFGSKMK
jgi:integrase